MRSARAFIVQEPVKFEPTSNAWVRSVDVRPAREWGELEFLLPGNHLLPQDPSAAIEALRAKLADFSDDDYLVLVGDLALVGYAVALAADANEGRVATLKWDRTQRRYLASRATLWDVKEEVS